MRQKRNRIHKKGKNKNIVFFFVRQFACPSFLETSGSSVSNPPTHWFKLTTSFSHQSHKNDVFPILLRFPHVIFLTPVSGTRSNMSCNTLWFKFLLTIWTCVQIVFILYQYFSDFSWCFSLSSFLLI